MLTVDVVKFYGSKAAAGRALRIGKAAVSKWGRVVPRHWASEFHVITNGKLRFHQQAYVRRRRQPEHA